MSAPFDGSAAKRSRVDGDGSGLGGALSAAIYQQQMAALAGFGGGGSGGHHLAAAAAPATSHYPSMPPPAQPHAVPLPAASPAPSASSSPPVPGGAAPPPPWMSEVPSFLESLNADSPLIPDEIVAHLLERAGCNCASEPQLVRLVALATHHFLHDLLTDARQIQRVRTKDSKDHTAELNLSDLSMALQQQGVTLAKPDCIVDNVFAGGMINVADAVATPQSNLAAAASSKEGTKKERAKK